MCKTSQCVCVLTDTFCWLTPHAVCQFWKGSPRRCRKLDLFFFHTPLCQRSDVELFVVLPCAPLTQIQTITSWLFIGLVYCSFLNG